MGQGKNFDYRKILRDFGELRLREGRLYAQRITAVYSGGVTSTGEWTPAVDLFETTDDIYLVAELPGVRKEDITIEVAGRTVNLRGMKPFARTGVSSETCYRMECSSGSFERSFTLPCEVDDTAVRATLRDGVLTVALPRRGTSGGRRVTVGPG